MAVRTSLTQWRSAGASPSMAVLAVRRKFETLTPGTSTGYCMARNMPARARSSTVIARTSSPSSGDRAGGDLVLGVAGQRVGERRLAGAVGAHDRVGLAAADRQVDAAQDRLGALLGLDADVQVADLEGGHRVAPPEFSGGVDVDEHARRRRRSRGRRAPGRVAGRASGRAGRAGRRSSRAASTRWCSRRPRRRRGRPAPCEQMSRDGVEVAVVVAHDGDLDGAGRALELHAQRRAGLDVGGQAGELGAHACAPVRGGRQVELAHAASSSASMAAMSRSSTSGTPICWTSSAKKPRTTSRRASASGMPRARR